MDEDGARQAFDEALRTYRQEFETFFLSRFVGLSFSYGNETLTVDFPIRDFMFNPQGSLHGGVVSFVLDVAMGHLLKHTLGVPGSTLEMKTQFLAPVHGGAARCQAFFLRRGKNICFLEGRLFDNAGTLAAVATSTWRVNRPGPLAPKQEPHQGTSGQS